VTNLAPQILVIQAVGSHLMTNMAPVTNHEYILQEGHLNL